MSSAHVKYLLVGAGLASVSAAQAIRELDHEGELMMIGQEINRPYHRPPLSKQYLRRQMTHDEIFTHAPGFFADQHIRLRTGHRATHLDAARRAVTLNNSEEVSFDRLLIATGASPRPLNIPGGELPNLFYLRSIEDVERLHHAIEQAERMQRGKARVAIIGGGLLGVEVAASLRQMKLNVDLIVAGNYPWHKFAGEGTGRFIARYLESRGITVHFGPPPARLEGDGRVQRVVLHDQRSIACDFAIAAVGAVMNKDILRSASIAAEKAILVDPRCRTNVEGIYAAGDCCAIFDPLFGKHRVLDHWDSAVVTGKIAGANMAGGNLAYATVNYFFSDVFDISLRAWGESRHVDHRLMRGTPNLDQDGFVEIGVAADGRISQVLSVNHPGDDEIHKQLIARRFQVAGNEEALKDPTFDLAQLL